MPRRAGTGWALALRFAILLAFVSTWELAGRAQLFGVTTLIPFTDVVVFLSVELRSGYLWAEAWHTLRTVGISVMGGIGAGLLIGGVMWWSQAFARLFEPVLAGALAIPMVLFYPVTLSLFGLGSTSIVLLAAITATLPIALNCWIALRVVSKEYTQVGLAYLPNGFSRFRKIYLPAATPTLFSGLRLGTILGLVSVIGMEFLISSAGLGYLVMDAYQFYQPRLMFGSMVFIVVIATMLNAVLKALEGRLRSELKVG